MTTLLQDAPQQAPRPLPRLGREDPLLRELWAIKAEMNAAEEFQVERLAQRAREFDFNTTLTALTTGR